MSQTISSSANRPYGLARVCRAWRVPRSTVYARHAQVSLDREPPRRRGPRRGIVSDADLLTANHAALEDSPWVGEGYRKVWARLRAAGVRTSRARVLRLMREHGAVAA